MSAEKKSAALSKATILIAVLLLLSILGMAALFFGANIKRAELQRHVELASEQLLLSQQMATYALAASSGSREDFGKLLQARQRFDEILEYYRLGDTFSNTQALPASFTGILDETEDSWRRYRTDIEVILGGRESISEVRELYQVIDSFIPQMLTYSDEVVGVLMKKRASPRQIYLASRQMMLSQRIKNNLNQVLAGGEAAAAAADRFGRDAALFGRVLEGLLEGSKSLRIDKVTDKEAVSKLREVAILISAVSDNIAGILELSPELFEVKEAASKVGDDSTRLLATLQSLQQQIVEQDDTVDQLQYGGIALGVLSIILMIIAGMMFLKEARNREAQALENNRRNQRAILRLLDEMANLADGDLTVHTTVTEEITGAIADSVNFTIDALRSLVTTINSTAAEVSNSAERTQSTAAELADASNKQAREIASASAAITDMAESMENVTKEAAESADVARKSVEIAQKGADVVRNTISSMDNIREQIQETSKRIKRLGESSQEIGDIVGLITEIADQTNILALNAAIQASTAGEAGRGFAVVADEVQRLAERAGNATKQIEGLVNTIQADTNEAVKSMEISTAGVVSGAAMAEDAGEALKEIEDVSGELSRLIQGISDSAKQQSAVANNVSQSMNVIQEITLQTSEGTEETSSALDALNELSSDLSRSVSGFKLPSEADESMETVVLENQA